MPERADTLPAEPDLSEAAHTSTIRGHQIGHDRRKHQTATETPPAQPESEHTGA